MSLSIKELLERVLRGDAQAEAELAESMKKPREVVMSYKVEVDTPELEIRFDPPFTNTPVITAHWESNEIVDSSTPLRSIGKLIPSPFKFPMIEPIISSPLGYLQLSRLAELDFKEFIPPLIFDIPQITFDIPTDFLDPSKGLINIITSSHALLNDQMVKIYTVIHQELVQEVQENLLLLPFAVPAKFLMDSFFSYFSRSMDYIFYYLLGAGGKTSVAGIAVSDEPGLITKLIFQLGNTVTDVQNRLTDVFSEAVKKSGEVIQTVQKQVYEKTNLITEKLNTVSEQLNNTVQGVNNQLAELEKRLNQSLGRINSMNDGVVKAINSLSAGFSSMAEATNEENSQIGEFINENLIILQEYIYQVQGMKNNLFNIGIKPNEKEGTSFGASEQQIEQLVPGLKRIKGIDRKNNDSLFQYAFPVSNTNKLKNKTFAVSPEPIDVIQPIQPIDEGTKTTTTTTTSWQRNQPDPYQMGVIDERAVSLPPSLVDERGVKKRIPPESTDPLPPMDRKVPVFTPVVKVIAEGSSTEMYQRSTISLPATKIISVTPSSVRIANPGKGSVLHLTAREPTITSAPA